MLIFGNGRLFTIWDELPFIENGAVAIEGSSIVEIGNCDELRSKYSDAEFIDAEGGVIMPGLVNAHTHSSRAFKRFRCDTLISTGTYEQRENDVDFESKLDFESCFASAYSCYTNALKNGVTTILDMFGCADPRGILFMLSGAAADIGIRACIGISASCRRGADEFNAACRENYDFLEYSNTEPMELIRPLFALDDLHCAEPEALKEVKAKLADRVTISISLSENADDGFYLLRKHGCTPVKYLLDVGLLNNNTLLAHCNNTSIDEARLAAANGATIIRTPDADLLCGERAANTSCFIDNGVLPCVGTDSFTDDMLSLPREILALQLKYNTCDDARTSVDMLLKANASLASRLFSKELGIIKPGACADIIALDYKPDDLINDKNLYRHILFGMRGAQCTHNMVNGRLLMRDRKLLCCKDKFLNRICLNTANKLS